MCSRALLAALAWSTGLLLAAGCTTPSESPPPDGGLPSLSCEPGTRAVEEGGFCEPIWPLGACPAGTGAFLGRMECLPVGWHGCDAGFRPAEDGWGCEAVLPDAGCEGASLGLPGQPSCVPMGDCLAPFPPPGATHFVDGALDAGDATHFLRISDALAAAPAGAVVAIERGTYLEGMKLTRSIQVVGRCAQEVVLKSPGGTAAGVEAGPGVVAQIQGVTLSGHRGGAVAYGGGQLTITGSLLSENRDLGIMAAGPGTQVVLERSKVRGTLASTTGALGRGLNIEAGARVALRDSTVEGNLELGIFALGPGTQVTLTGSVVRDTQGSAGGTGGRGLYVKGGARAVVKGSALISNRDIGLFVIGAGSAVEMEGSVIQETRVAGDGQYGRAISAQDQATLSVRSSRIFANHDTGVEVTGAGTSASLREVAIVDTRSDGLGSFGGAVYVKDGASLEVWNSALVGNRGMSATIRDPNSSLSVVDSLIFGTLPDGRGLFGGALVVAFGGVASVNRSALVNNQWVGVMAVEPRSQVTLFQTLLSGTGVEGSSGLFGHGLVALAGSRVDASDSVVIGNASLGALYAEGGGALLRTLVRDHPVGLHLQSGSRFAQDGTGAGSLGVQEVLVSPDTRFWNNTVRLGTGELPLPQPALGLR